jgi:hypothetical protein
MDTEMIGVCVGDVLDFAPIIPQPGRARETASRSKSGGRAPQRKAMKSGAFDRCDFEHIPVDPAGTYKTESFKSQTPPIIICPWPFQNSNPLEIW